MEGDYRVSDSQNDPNEESYKLVDPNWGQTV